MNVHARPMNESIEAHRRPMGNPYEPMKANETFIMGAPRETHRKPIEAHGSPRKVHGRTLRDPRKPTGNKTRYRALPQVPQSVSHGFPVGFQAFLVGPQELLWISGGLTSASRGLPWTSMGLWTSVDFGWNSVNFLGSLVVPH